jgi:putative Mg2+ transporter-C (MgtC) family protein
VSIQEEVIRLLVAAGLGCLIGLERERLDRGAGLRTHALVATASALLMLVSSFGFTDVIVAGRIVLDPSRVAAQVVSGIGFLGAGTIILRKNAVRGLTTAASIWAVAAIGLACGAGLYIPAIATTIILLTILIALKPIERRLFAHKRAWLLTVHAHQQKGLLTAIEISLRESGLELSRMQLESDTDNAETTIRLELRGGGAAALGQLAERVQELGGVTRVSYRGRALSAHELASEEVDEDATRE